MPLCGAQAAAAGQLLSGRAPAGRLAGEEAAQREQYCGHAGPAGTMNTRLHLPRHAYRRMRASLPRSNASVWCASCCSWSARRGARAWAGRWTEPARRKAAASRAHCHRCSTHISGEVLTRTKSLFKKIRPIHSSSGRYCMRADKHTRSYRL